MSPSNAHILLSVNIFNLSTCFCLQVHYAVFLFPCHTQHSSLHFLRVMPPAKVHPLLSVIIQPLNLCLVIRSWRKVLISVLHSVFLRPFLSVLFLSLFLISSEAPSYLTTRWRLDVSLTLHVSLQRGWKIALHDISKCSFYSLYLHISLSIFSLLYLSHYSSLFPYSWRFILERL